jgi:hypothetical protein
MLVASASMREYFREALGTAIKKTDVRLTDTAQAYLVNLLAEFVRSDAAFAGTDKGERPALVDLFTRAQEADPSEAVRIYKHMGDSSLYMSGFFQESVEESVGVEYYVSMGGSAYASVAGIIRPTAATSSALFAELSDRFREIVELLVAMSLQAEKTKVDNVSVLGLVERYQKTGDKRVLDALKKQGIVLRPFAEDDDVN